MAEPHTGSETIGAAGEKSSMTLFKDDRAEDLGAILLAVLAIALVVAISFLKGQPTPAATAPTAAPTPAPAGPGAPPTPRRP